MSYSQKYTIVHFLEPVAEHMQFNMDDWPLHITLADVFAADFTQQLIEQLAVALQPIKPVVVIAGNDTVLGSTKVVLLDATAQLKLLHKELITFLETQGAVFNTPEYNHEGFLPHATLRKTVRLHKGDRVKITTLSVIDMFPDSQWQQRKIVGTVRLG